MPSMLPSTHSSWITAVPIKNLYLIDVNEPLPVLEVLNNSSVVSRIDRGLALTICAESPGAVQVAFYFYNVPVRIDSSVPFCLEDKLNMKFPSIVEVWQHNVTAQALDANGIALGPPYSISFGVAPVPVTGLFLLIPSDPVPVVVILSNSSIISRDTVGLQLTVCAEAVGAEKVIFIFDGFPVSTDEDFPLCIQDNYGTEYMPLLDVGRHNVTVQAIDSSNQAIGPAYSVEFTVAPVMIQDLFLIDTTLPLPPIGSLLSMTTVNIAETGDKLTVCAVADGAMKVAFYFDDKVWIDHSYPFCLGGQLSTDYEPLSDLTHHEVTVVALDDNELPMGPPLSVIFNVVDTGPVANPTGEITVLTVINTNKIFPIVGFLTNSSVIDLSDSGTSLTICAKANGAPFVSFFFDGNLIGIEIFEPFCFSQNYNTPNTLLTDPGQHEVVAYPGGFLGKPDIVTFDVAPIPVKNLLLIDVRKPLPEIEILLNSTIVSRQNHGLELTICAEAHGAAKVAFYFDGDLILRDDALPFCLNEDLDRAFYSISSVGPHNVAPVPVTSLLLVKTTDPVPSIEFLSNLTVVDPRTMGSLLTVCAQAPGAEKVRFFLGWFASRN
jgi:hypothetical protein